MRRSPVKVRFAVCVKNEGYPASLDPWKIYQVVPDWEARKHDQIRVIDESGEDYLYPREYFRLVALPTPLRRLFPTKAVA